MMTQCITFFFSFYTRKDFYRKNLISNELYTESDFFFSLSLFINSLFALLWKCNRYFLLTTTKQNGIKRGKSLATLRERVERQRSVTSSVNHGSESNSLEGLNLERGDSNYKSRCVEQLDNQVSTLHQDVAALSVEVNIVQQ